MQSLLDGASLSGLLDNRSGKEMGRGEAEHEFGLICSESKSVCVWDGAAQHWACPPRDDES